LTYFHFNGIFRLILLTIGSAFVDLFHPVVRFIISWSCLENPVNLSKTGKGRQKRLQALLPAQFAVHLFIYNFESWPLKLSMESVLRKIKASQ
jgi:hypothetical protein